MTEKEQQNQVIAMQVRLGKGMEAVSISELCEIRWQAAIMYAQKSHKALQERKTPMAEYNKHLAIDCASKVWRSMGFTENEVTEHLKAFTDTILCKGGTYKSVTDYFCMVIKEDKMYPRADANANGIEEGVFHGWDAPNA